jgi:NAD(P)-dependent dehydrogenase (short-subunit alcohol dehydrogenase family)
MAYAPFDLAGKVALVTGGNRGIGFGFAEALSQAGAAVAIWGSNEKNNAEAVKKLGGKTKAWTVNVAEETQVADAMADVARHFGRIDSVFANAGISGGARSFAEFPTETWRRVLSVNLDGVFFTLREAAKHMVDRAKAGDPGGSLVAVASLAAIEGAPRNEAYAATKGAVISMMKSIAVEHARYGVRANSILPGWIATDMTQGAQDNPAFAEKVIPRVPMRRWGEPKDFGGVAVYLTSDASSYHSGDAFVIDGGYSIF